MAETDVLHTRRSRDPALIIGREALLAHQRALQTTGRNIADPSSSADAEPPSFGSLPGGVELARRGQHEPRARAVEALVAVGDDHAVLAHGAELVPAGPLLEERHLGEGTRDIEAAGRDEDQQRGGNWIPELVAMAGASLAKQPEPVLRVITLSGAARIRPCGAVQGSDSRRATAGLQSVC